MELVVSHHIKVENAIRVRKGRNRSTVVLEGVPEDIKIEMEFYLSHPASGLVPVAENNFLSTALPVINKLGRHNDERRRPLLVSIPASAIQNVGKGSDRFP
jgi:hypothetical protein